MGFLTGTNILMMNPSIELSKIIPSGCVYCYEELNITDSKAMIIGPCQHIFCERCVNTVIFKKNRKIAECTECSKQVHQSFAQLSRFFGKIFQTFQQLSKYKLDQDKAEEMEREVALKFSKNKQYECIACKHFFDSQQRRPVNVCKKQHIICQVCLKSNEEVFKKCRQCGEKTDPSQFYFNNLVINVCDFITKTLYNTKLCFTYAEQSFTLTIDGSLSIRNIFHYLQEYDLISKNLEIKQCKFEIKYKNGYQTIKSQVKQDRKIDSIKMQMKNRRQTLIISMECDQTAKQMGGKVTMSSKVINDLAIKIDSFQPQQKLTSAKYHFSPNFKKKQQISQNPIRPRQQVAQISKDRQPEIKQISVRKQSKIKKRLEKERGTKIEDERMYKLASNAPQYERGQIWNKFLINHEVKDQDQALICLMCEKIMNRQFTEGELCTSKALQKQINEQAETGAKSAKPSKTALLSMILKILKAELNDGKIQVIFTPKSTDRSKLSLKTITSHFLSDRIILKQVLDEDQQWYLQKLYDSNEDLQNFVAKQRKRVSQSFGVSENSLVFHDIIKGSNILVMSTNQSENVVNHLKVNLNRKIELHPYFTRLQLSPADFDQKGCIDFPNDNPKDKRGGLPYYPPIDSSRYGIKVSKIFDHGNDRWLSMDNLPGEWAVAFHGVKHPNAAFKSYKNVVQSILSSLHRSQKEKLIVVQNIKQIHCNDNCINKKGQKISEGVYLTPFFVQALPFTTVIDISQKKYNLVFQCRLNPQNIKFSAENQNIWVVNRSADIRPYGIVLIEHKKGYPSPLAQFGENFDYNKYKDQFMENIAAKGLQAKNSIISHH